MKNNIGKGILSVLLVFFIGLGSPIWSQDSTVFTEAELIGKGNPELFGEGIGLRKEAYDSFLRMQQDALKEGIQITVVSGYRNFERQKGIFERKYRAYTGEGLSGPEAIRKIIEYSTIPGTSRHHWGTDIDIIDTNATYSGDVLVADKFEGNGPFSKLKAWLDKHANAYGFYMVYTPDAKRKGFKYEPWHYSYAPISQGLLREYRKLDLKSVLTREKLEGSEFLTDDFIKKYRKEQILDINPFLLR